MDSSVTTTPSIRGGTPDPYLLAHGSYKPKKEVQQYLKLLRDIVPIDRFSGRFKHIELARIRSSHLLSAVWKIVVNDCVEIDVNPREAEPAGDFGAILLEDQGPYPKKYD
jgi:hypothetical protein